MLKSPVMINSSDVVAASDRKELTSWRKTECRIMSLTQ